MSRRPVHVVPHTHWDREWYRSFQDFRMRLVDLMDELLEILVHDPSFSCFMLDGQMAVVDDYLAMRPEAEDTLRSLALSGRITVGPWYILMDEFLVSGETIVRDLQMGLERAGTFGGAMNVGYLPDMFGHIAQMPQILAQAGMGHAVVWRGVPNDVTATGFWWEAPDGSCVRAEYLTRGYGNGAALPRDPEKAAAMIADLEKESAPFLLDGLLLMNGTDHQMPRPWLGEVVTGVNECQESYDVSITTLAGALDAAPTEGLSTWRGELRSSGRANLLMGVASNRVDVKIAAARAERSLERRAEPLCALIGDGATWPARFLDSAWTLMVQNSAHDSICACSVDEVCDAVLHRYAEARQIGDGLAAKALDSLAATLACTGAVLVNVCARARAGVVDLTLPGTVAPDGAQIVSQRSEVLWDATMAGDDVKAIMGEVRSQQVNDDTYIVDISMSVGSEAIELSMGASPRLTREFPIEPVKTELLALIDAHPDLPVHLHVTQPPVTRVVARTTPVPGFGWARWEPVPAEDAVTVARAPGNGKAGAPQHTLSNGLTTVEVAADGSLTIDGTPGFNVLVDGGDHGDTYNYSPPTHDTVVQEPESVTVEVVESGPVRGTLRIVRSYAWPERIDDHARSRVGSLSAEVETTVSLHAGERLVRMQTTFINAARDHRLRAHFPTLEGALTSTAECAFGTVTRGLVAEGGFTERGLATYPSRRFVRAGGITVVHEGLLEYELVGDDGASPQPGPGGAAPPARAIALTLLRATGMLSRVEMAYRPMPAGPPIPLEGSQVLGPVRVSYGVLLGECDPYAVADDFLLPLEVVTAHGEGDGPGTGTLLEVSGAQVSSLRRSSGSLEIRVFNPSGSATDVSVPGRSGWLVDLRGRPLEHFTGGFPLGPWRIATARLTG